jgi:hypothetical protein
VENAERLAAPVIGHKALTTLPDFTLLDGAAADRAAGQPPMALASS